MSAAQNGDELLEAVRRLAAQGDGEAALELFGRNWRVWQASGQPDKGSAAAELALGAPGSSDSVWRTRTLYADGLFAFRMGDIARSLARNEETLRVARNSGDLQGECDGLTGLARIALREGRYEDVVTRAAQGRELARTAGDPEAEAGPLHLHAAGLRLQGRYAQARDLYLESLDLNARLGTTRMVAAEHHNLGWVELHLGDAAAAADHFRERDALAGSDAYGDAWTDLNWAAVAVMGHDAAEARRRFVAGKKALDATGLTLDPDDQAELGWLTVLVEQA